MAILAIFAALIFIAAVFGLAIWSVVRSEARAAQMLDKWLRDNNYQLLQKSAPWIRDNPFFLSSNRSQKVFKVAVRTSEVAIRHAWLRCGHALFGTAIEQIEVKWDDSI